MIYGAAPTFPSKICGFYHCLALLFARIRPRSMPRTYRRRHAFQLSAYLLTRIFRNEKITSCNFFSACNVLTTLVARRFNRRCLPGLIRKNSTKRTRKPEQAACLTTACFKLIYGRDTRIGFLCEEIWGGLP